MTKASPKSQPKSPKRSKNKSNVTRAPRKAGGLTKHDRVLGLLRAKSGTAIAALAVKRDPVSAIISTVINVSIVPLLLESGADPMLRDSSGRLAVYEAAKFYEGEVQRDIVRELLSASSNLEELFDKRDSTPIGYE